MQKCTDCGCVSIHLGALTVRLDDSSLELLSKGLGEACDALQATRVAELRHRVPQGVA